MNAAISTNRLERELCSDRKMAHHTTKALYQGPLHGGNTIKIDIDDLKIPGTDVFKNKLGITDAQSLA